VLTNDGLATEKKRDQRDGLGLHRGDAHDNQLALLVLDRLLSATSPNNEEDGEGWIRVKEEDERERGE